MNELVRRHTALSETDLEWLHLLVSEWQLLADLSFADLVLWVPTVDGARYVPVALMRPNTGPTSYQDDMVGHTVPRGRRPMLDVALDEGRIVREGDPEWREEVPVRIESIPVRRESRVLGVIARNTNLLTVRTPSRLELITGLQDAGVSTALLSNAPASMARVVKDSDWSAGFDQRVFSCDLGLVKLCSALRGRWVEPDETAELLAPYGEWAGLAGVYLLRGWSRGLVPGASADRARLVRARAA